MLGPADGTPGVDLDLEEADVAHTLEVGSHGVRMEAEGVGHLGGRERTRGARQLEVDGVARVVAQRLEHSQPGVDAGR